MKDLLKVIADNKMKVVLGAESFSNEFETRGFNQDGALILDLNGYSRLLHSDSIRCIQFEQGNKALVFFEKEHVYRASLSEKFLYAWQNGGSFMEHLCEAIIASDSTNLEKLHAVYPDLVNGYHMWKLGRMYK